MDLVVCHEVYDNEVTYTQIKCCRYESAEAFLVDFEKKLIETKEAFAEDTKKRQEWMSSQPKLNVHGRKKSEQEMKTVTNEQDRGFKSHHPDIDKRGSNESNQKQKDRQITFF